MKAWLLAILHNAYVDLYRRRQHLPEPVDMDIDDMAVVAEHPGSVDAFLAHSAEDAVLAAGFEEAVDRALLALPAEWRLVVVLADLEGLAYKEISEITQAPIGTVMSRLHRSRKRLHDELLQYARTVGYATEMGQ